MNITRKLLLISIALSLTAPAQAQSPKQGDDYTPTQTVAQELSPAELRQAQEGDYFDADHIVLHRHRIAALTTCTDGIKFASGRYITCMLREGENP